jgi:hypothetical protein
LVDAEADCRFCIFFEKRRNKWGATFDRHWYERDKLIPVDPRKVPRLDDLKLETYPNGYRYLAYFQEATMGVKVKMDIPGHRNDGDSVTGREHDKLYFQIKHWLDWEKVDI